MIDRLAELGFPIRHFEGQIIVKYLFEKEKNVQKGFKGNIPVKNG